MNELKTLKDHWETLRMSKASTQSERIAYVAGATAMLNCIRNAARSKEEEPQETLDRLLGELRSFSL